MKRLSRGREKRTDNLFYDWRGQFARFTPITSPVNGTASAAPAPLSAKVLLLNQNYEPLSVCSVQKAIVLLWLGKAEMVETRTNRVVRTISAAYPYPSVIRLGLYVRIPFRKVELSRKNILRRDGHRCVYCKTTAPPLTVDHVIPRSRGGEDSWENLVCACVRCNNKKGSRTPEEANMNMLFRPFRPNYVTFIQNVVGRIEQEWEPYLFMR